MPLTHNSDSLETRNLTVHDALMLGDDTALELREMAPPVKPPTGSVTLYAKTDGRLHMKDGGGAEFDVTTGAAGGADVAVADGGTGASTASGARTNLGLAIGADVAAAAHITSGTLDSNRLATKNRTLTKIVYVESPKATDSFPIAFLSDAVTIVQVHGVTDTGAVDFNIEHRATHTPGVAGTDTLTSDLRAIAAGASSTSFADATVPPDRWLSYNASAIAGSPTKLWVAIEFTID